MFVFQWQENFQEIIHFFLNGFQWVFDSNIDEIKMKMFLTTEELSSGNNEVDCFACFMQIYIFKIFFDKIQSYRLKYSALVFIIQHFLERDFKFFQ